ncbi:hypothetical protein FWF89_02205 [Candidatus Saccharibacteria bacterium]|nr:hypothetical protein [Candidatus Saccharibacteria bacterium]
MRTQVNVGGYSCLMSLSQFLSEVKGVQNRHGDIVSRDDESIKLYDSDLTKAFGMGRVYNQKKPEGGWLCYMHRIGDKTATVQFVSGVNSGHSLIGGKYEVPLDALYDEP